jgi:hypothetical protein
VPEAVGDACCQRQDPACDRRGGAQPRTHPRIGQREDGRDGERDQARGEVVGGTRPELGVHESVVDRTERGERERAAEQHRLAARAGWTEGMRARGRLRLR